MRKKETAPPDIGEGKRGEEGYLGYLLRQAANAQRRRMERALADLAITPPQFASLTMIGAYPGLSNARRITFEYVMLKGVNDSPEDARRLRSVALAFSQHRGDVVALDFRH